MGADGRGGGVVGEGMDGKMVIREVVAEEDEVLVDLVADEGGSVGEVLTKLGL